MIIFYAKRKISRTAMRFHAMPIETQNTILGREKMEHMQLMQDALQFLIRRNNRH
jgi:hypothetical protein